MRTHLFTLGICIVVLSTTVVFSMTSCSPYSPMPPPTQRQTISANQVASKIDRHPLPATAWRKVRTVPSFDPNSTNPYQVDLRSSDLRSLDLTNSASDLMYADFDSRTQWPPQDQMPGDYDPVRVMSLGTNPGLGVLSLHARGITGRGVSIAIVDQPLLVEHQEYAARLFLYEEINVDSRTTAQMHGPAVASIAVGETVGVAPQADLYYEAAFAFDGLKGYAGARDFRYIAAGVRRITAINSQLPADKKIRAISLSIGWDPSEAGYTDISAAVEEAKAQGIFILSSSLEQTYGFKMQGLGRYPLADADNPNSYEPGLFWASRFPEGGMRDRLLIPMDSRTVASPSGNDEYTFFRAGGWSWITPYLAGVYALAVQVDPGITPDRFWSLAMLTANRVEFENNDKRVPLGPILDPVALIKALEYGQSAW